MTILAWVMGCLRMSIFYNTWLFFKKITVYNAYNDIFKDVYLLKFVSKYLDVMKNISTMCKFTVCKYLLTYWIKSSKFL